MLRALGRWFRTATRDPLPPSAWLAVQARVPWVGALDPSRQQRLAGLARAFLRTKAITPLDGLVLDEADRACLAALCSLPLLEFGEGGLAGWSQLLVYPAAFRVNRSHVDAAGVLHEWDDELIGESWDAGPLVLSWADVRSDLVAPREGFCVAAHEMAHKLDALDGAMDGTPPLPRAWQQAWARVFQEAFDDLAAEVDAGRDTAIDGYAAESPEEFFAVCTEYHFSDAPRLRARFPAVAEHLARLYGPPPFDRAPDRARA